MMNGEQQLLNPKGLQRCPFRNRISQPTGLFATTGPAVAVTVGVLRGYFFAGVGVGEFGAGASYVRELDIRRLECEARDKIVDSAYGSQAFRFAD